MGCILLPRENREFDSCTGAFFAVVGEPCAPDLLYIFSDGEEPPSPAEAQKNVIGTVWEASRSQ